MGIVPRSILGDTDRPYLTFNEDGDVICDKACDNRAKWVSIVARERTDADAQTGDASVYGSRQCILVDNHYLWFGQAACGVHRRDGFRGQPVISATLLHGEPLMDFDILKRAYERWVFDRQQNIERERAAYRKYQRDIAAMPTSAFSVEYSEGRRYEPHAWVINGPGHGEVRPVTKVYVANEEGLWLVQTSDYSGHTGRGRGAPALARIVARILLQAADIAEEHNREEEA